MLKELAIIIIGYLIGSVPFSYIIGRLFQHIDIRKFGTKNPGASNVFLVVGPFAAVLALIGDISKGIIAVMLAQSFNAQEYIIVACGIAAILGHCFPVFLKFKGGKGMATSIGVVTVLAPKETIIALVALLFFSLAIKRLVLSLLIAISLLPFLAFYFDRSLVIIIALIIIAFLQWVFNFNKKRLLSGEDYKKLISKLKWAK